MTAAKKTRPKNFLLSKARLAEMIEAATVDAHGESEQTTGWFTMISRCRSRRPRARSGSRHTASGAEKGDEHAQEDAPAEPPGMGRGA